MKGLLYIFWFRVFAVYDVLTASKFELEAYDKHGIKKASTKFDRQEIIEVSKKGFL